MSVFSGWHFLCPLHYSSPIVNLGFNELKLIIKTIRYDQTISR